jgi:tryptophanyl-tRNA synthetase
MQSPCRKPWSRSVFIISGMPPTSNMSFGHVAPAGLQVAM